MIECATAREWTVHKKQYPGIVTAFLQKERERTPRGLHSNLITGGYSCQMSQDDFYFDLKAAISNDRATPYYTASRRVDSQAFGAYAWNLALCESVYPALNSIEICLRNSINAAAIQEFGTTDWFPMCLHEREIDVVSQLSSDLRASGRANGPSDLVSNLTLGFWLSLFRIRYEQVLWPKLLEAVFPHCPRSQRTRQNVYVRLEKIRRLRNRVFHHEPIWHLPDLPKRHEEILETIDWISPAMLAATRLLDRFDSVYTRGSQPYAAELETIAQDWNV